MRTGQSGGGGPGDLDSSSEARPYSRSSDYVYENQANQSYRSGTVREADSFSSRYSDESITPSITHPNAHQAIETYIKETGTPPPIRSASAEL